MTSLINIVVFESQNTSCKQKRNINHTNVFRTLLCYFKLPNGNFRLRGRLFSYISLSLPKTEYHTETVISQVYLFHKNF